MTPVSPSTLDREDTVTAAPATTATPATDTAVVRLREVCKSFGGAVALNNVSLDLYPGEVHALMGMNGAGKSTLVKVLSGVHGPDSGRIEVAGRPQSAWSTRRARRQGVSIVPQRRELVLGLTVAENIMLGDLPTRRSVVRWSSVTEIARNALAQLGIDIDVTRPAGELTVAEQTMVEVAREVRRGGRVLILDEPTACLGAAAAAQIRALVRRLRDSGVAVVFISHYIDEVLAIADRVTVLREGAVVTSYPVGATDEAGLVRDMVGRDVVSVRPARAPARDEIGLRIRDLSQGRFLDGFDVDVRDGEIVAVLGPAGDGQSRLFDLLSGRRRPDRGTLTVGGKRVPPGRVGRSLASGLRCVTGDRRRLGLVPELSVDENLVLAEDRLAGRVVQRWDRLGRRAAALRDEYRVVSLTRNPAVDRLSGGNQQKVLLAKWFATEPAACLLEDPTNGVDIAAMAEIHTLIDRLAERGAAVLLASSSCDEVMRLADRVIIVRDGRAIAEHKIDDITRDELIAAVLGGEGA